VRRALVTIVVIVVVTAVAARARAEPDLGADASEREWPRWRIGVRAPLEIATIRGGGLREWAIASGAVHAELLVGRLAVLAETEIDAVVGGAVGTFARVGADARLYWWRAIAGWTRYGRGRSESRDTIDGFVEIGAGWQWLDVTGAAFARRDLAIGIGFEPGSRMTRDASGRRGVRYLAAFLRLRLIVAPAVATGSIMSARCAAPAACGAASPGGYDLGVGFDVGFAFGR
jgi:hypothetical protein